MSRETLTITASNTHFADLFRHPESVQRLLGNQGPTVVGFTEASPGCRHLAKAAIEAYGYQAIFPEGTNMDTVWAVSPDIQVLSSTAIPFDKHRLQRMGGMAMGDRKRHIGVHGLTIMTPSGQKVRLSNNHPSPPVLEFFRRSQMRAIEDVLQNHPYFAPDEEVIDIDMGDKNHYPGPSQATLAWYADRGYYALLEPGTGTCDVHRTHHRVARYLERLGKTALPQLDAIYVRPNGRGQVVRCTNESDITALASNAIGHQTNTATVASDHLAVEATLYLPSRAPGSADELNYQHQYQSD